MPQNIALLTTPEFGAVAVGPLRTAASDQVITTVYTEDGLRDAMTRWQGPARLIAFATGVIVPPDMLRAFEGGAYNFHSGPPTYPGLFPSVFAIYDGAAKFGATLHEMTAALDNGPIIATEWFDLPPTADRLTVDTLALRAMLNLLNQTAGQLVKVTRPLQVNGEQWTGRVRRKRDFDELCRLPENVSRQEFERRYRAVGEGPHHALELTVHGHRFTLDNRRGTPVVRASAPLRRTA